MTRKDLSSKGELLAKDIIEIYQPKTVKDIQNALTDIFAPMVSYIIDAVKNYKEYIRKIMYTTNAIESIHASF